MLLVCFFSTIHAGHPVNAVFVVVSQITVVGRFRELWATRYHHVTTVPVAVKDNGARRHYGQENQATTTADAAGSTSKHATSEIKQRYARKAT